MSELDSILRQLGTRIRDTRERQQLTQGQLAARAGRSVKFVGEIERGQANPTIEYLVALAHALGVSLQYLLAHPGAADARVLSGWDVRRIEDSVATLSTYFRRRPRSQQRRGR